MPPAHDGSSLPVDVADRPPTASGVESFAEAVAASRLEALREFAYGAGHEINNPLANIAARAQSLLVDEADPVRRRALATIVDQAFRARDMIGGLMIFARPPQPAPVRIAVDSLVRRALDAASPIAGSRDVRLEYRAWPRPLEVHFDPAHGVEVIRLLLINAVEAGAAGGRVTLSSGVEDGRVVLTIDDDGSGLRGETLRKAFDPFFSGREAGRGIGMGLPKAWRLLDIGGGDVRVGTRPGPGTQVIVHLPAAST